MEDYYPCTDSALNIDLQYFVEKHNDNDKVCFLVIIVCNIALIFTNICQFMGHYSMMIRWYKENPIDGREIARSIQVGIPPEKEGENCNKSREDEPDMHIGFTVPEADREVVKTSMSHLKNEAVAALAVEEESYQVMVDLKNSSPIKLPRQTLMSNIKKFLIRHNKKSSDGTTAYPKG